MLNLILKDYIFTRRQMAVGIIYCLVAPLLLVIDGGSKNYWAQFFIPFCLVSFLLSKIFYIEDSTDVRYFLKMLPYNTCKRVASRYCFMVITLISSEIYLWFIQCVVFKQNLYEVIKGNLIPIIIFLLYYSLYIMLGYCFGYLIAQNTIYVCMVTAGILALAYEKLSLNIDFALLANKHSIIVLSIVSIGIIFFFFFFACKGCEKREN